MVIGIPVLVLQDAEGMTVTIETRSDDTYRGFLASVEDCMNCRMSNVFVTRRDGSTMHLDHIFVPGRQIRLVVLPQILEKAPVFGRVRDAKDGKEHVRGLGRGRYLARDAMRGEGLRGVVALSRLGLCALSGPSLAPAGAAAGVSAGPQILICSASGPGGPVTASRQSGVPTRRRAVDTCSAEGSSCHPQDATAARRVPRSAPFAPFRASVACRVPPSASLRGVP